MKNRGGLISIEIPGAEALEAALRELGEAVEIRKTLSKALMEAAEPMAKAARAGAPRGATGRLYESIDVAKTLSRRQRQQANRYAADNPTNATVYVGAKPIGPSILLEFGTTARHWKSGKSTGSVPARPFMRPAFESEKMGALDLLGKLIWIQIEKAAARIARKTAKAARK
jgi:hypothetical protein